jgi:hypothetical protein
VLELVDQHALALVIGVACFAIGAWLGSWFPDIDRIQLFRLRHRSTVTHGFLMPVLTFFVAGATRIEWADWIVAGIAAGVALHLAFDLFPGKWRGFALVDVPKYGRCTKTVSVVWLFVNVFLCAGMSVSIIPTLGILSFTACVATLAALYLYGVGKKKEHYAAGPLLALLALGADAL